MLKQPELLDGGIYLMDCLKHGILVDECKIIYSESNQEIFDNCNDWYIYLTLAKHHDGVYISGSDLPISECCIVKIAGGHYEDVTLTTFTTDLMIAHVYSKDKIRSVFGSEVMSFLSCSKKVLKFKLILPETTNTLGDR